MGKIQVTVQTEKRLQAINNLSAAILEVAKALSQGTHVEVSHNNFSGCDPALEIKTDENVTETIIKEIQDAEPQRHL